VDEIAISKFKATCLSVLERARRSGQPVRITRFGQPVADVVPPPPAERPKSWIGSMKGAAITVGDVVSPVVLSVRARAIGPARSKRTHRKR
jgi:prevent-host-death family protein